MHEWAAGAGDLLLAGDFNTPPESRVYRRDWAGYPILRFPQVPQHIDIHIVPRPGQPFLGTGEVAQGPTPAMIANAVADATGARLRQLPLSRERVRNALRT